MFDAKRTLIRALVMGLTLIAAGCGGNALLSQKTASGDSRLIARADQAYQLTVQQFYEALSQSMVQPQGGTVSGREITDFRDSMVADTISGFAADDEIDLPRYWSDNWNYRLRYNSLLLGSYLEQNLGPKVVADSSEVVAYYTQHPDYFKQPEQVEVLHIMASATSYLNGRDSLKYRAMPRSEVDSLAHDHILQAKHALDSGMAFKEAAVRYSQEIHAPADSGYVGWTGRNTFRPPFDSIAFNLKPGTYCEPYVDVDGWHIVLVAQYLAAGTRGLDHPQVYETAKQMLMGETARQLTSRLLDSLSRNATYKVNEPLLDSNLYNVTDSLWFAVINDIDTIDVLLMRNAENSIKQRLQIWNTTPDQKRQVLMGLVRQFSAIQTARRERIDTLSEVRAQNARIHHEQVKSVILRQWFDRDWKPSDSAIEAYYKANQKDFRVDKPLTVQQIVSKDSTLAIFIRDQARSGVDFLDLAKQYYPGEESIRAELADLGKIGPKDVDTAFYRVAYSLAPGDVSDPVKTKYGWHVIKLLKHEDSQTLQDARITIMTKLTDEYRLAQFRQFQKRIFAKYHVTFPYTPKSGFLEPFAYRKKPVTKS